MALRIRFQDTLKQAMRAKDEITVGTLRLITAAMKDRDIAARTKGNWEGILDDEILSMLQSMVKQRQESIKMYEAGRRQDLVDRELSEIRVIETFLPKQLSDDEMKEAVAHSIQTVGAGGIKDMGKVMTELKSRYAGQIDFGKASSLVKEKLAG